ncbi:Ig domain-containing protein [Burkholderia ubonensis]|uniref:Ig domain-containing protein n=1 Tax=Burkholderia ubonensis TaxID=101571 RepID=UPI0007561073|nr:Ig domain-containing protein [Burkholderia ubonensis]KVP16943.1 hypothetical protein WJ84_01325 [Burkholderia ubonensis]
MLKTSLLAAALAVTSLTAAAADYYVVVPVPGKTPAQNIQVSLEPGELPAAAMALEYTYDFSAHLRVTGDTSYTSSLTAWRASGVPAGLTFVKGVISGTPVAQGTYSITVQSAYKGRTGQQTYALQVGPVSIVDKGGYRQFADGSMAPNCNAYLNASGNYAYAGATGDGVYRIQPVGQAASDAWCDMTKDGGGWTLVMRGFGGSGQLPVNWDTTAGENESVPPSPSSTITIKLADATLNAIRGASGVYRLMSDGKYSQKRFVKSFSYGHTTIPAASSAGVTTYASLNWDSPRIASTGWLKVGVFHGGISDDDGAGGMYFGTNNSGDPNKIGWVLGNGGGSLCIGSVPGCNFTMWVR